MTSYSMAKTIVCDLVRVVLFEGAIQSRSDRADR